MAAILPRLNAPDTVLKQDHRARVGVIELNGVRYVVKRFTIQSNWFWFQLASLFFPDVGEIAYRNGIELAKAGVPTPRPALLMQRIRRGMVVESWLVYRFLEGELLTAGDAGEIVAFIKRMHNAGWVHRDPHPSNFIRQSTDGGQVAALDPIRARRSRSPYRRAYDVMLLARDMPAAPELYGRRNLGFWLMVAGSVHALFGIYRQVKYLVRRVVGTPKYMSDER